MNSFLLLLSFSERRFYLFTQLASFAVALHLSRRRTNTRSHTLWHTFVWLCICIVSDKDSAEGQEGGSAARAVQFETQQSYAAWYDAECQTWETHRYRWSRVHLLLLLLLHHLLSLTFFPPSSSLTTPFTLVFSLLCANFELHKEEGVGSAIYRTYTNIYDWFHMSSAADSSLSGCEVFWQ